MLRARGVLPHDRVTLTHFFSHFGGAAEEAAAFRRALWQAGFGDDRDWDVSSDVEADDPYYLHHCSHTLARASAAVLARADSLAREIAFRHGVRYDGWIVQRQHRRGWVTGTYRSLRTEQLRQRRRGRAARHAFRRVVPLQGPVSYGTGDPPVLIVRVRRP